AGGGPVTARVVVEGAEEADPPEPLDPRRVEQRGAEQADEGRGGGHGPGTLAQARRPAKGDAPGACKRPRALRSHSPRIMAKKAAKTQYWLMKSEPHVFSIDDLE